MAFYVHAGARKAEDLAPGCDGKRVFRALGRNRPGRHRCGRLIRQNPGPRTVGCGQYRWSRLVLTPVDGA